MSDKKISKEEIEDIEYLQKILFKSLKIPPHLHGLKEEMRVWLKKFDEYKTKQR